MIFVMTDKAFTKNAKKLVKPKNYFIFDATDDGDAELTKYTNVITIGGFAPPSKLIKARKDSDSISEDKLRKLEKKHFASDDFIAPMFSMIKALTDTNSPINVFLILSKKAYGVYGKKIIKRFHKYYDVDFEFIYDIGDLKDDKKALSKDLSKKKIEKLEDLHHKLIKSISKKDKDKKKK